MVATVATYPHYRLKRYHHRVQLQNGYAGRPLGPDRNVFPDGGAAPFKRALFIFRRMANYFRRQAFASPMSRRPEYVIISFRWSIPGLTT